MHLPHATDASRDPDAHVTEDARVIYGHVYYTTVVASAEAVADVAAVALDACQSYSQAIPRHDRRQ